MRIRTDRKKKKQSLWALLWAAAMVLVLAAGPARAVSASAAGMADPAGQAVVLDECDLLTDAEEAALLEDMAPITENYCGAAFVSTRSSYAAGAAQDYFRELFGRDSAVLFLVDMQDREIRIFADGAAFSRVTTRKADTITDNVYNLASKGQYYECASKAFYQMGRVLAGKPIAEPMRYIGCAMIAVIISVLINFAVAAAKTSRTKAPAMTLEESAIDRLAFGDIEKANYKKTKTRHIEVESGSGRSGGGFSGGGGGFSGGGGGGFSSGGGGGHSF